MKTFGSPITGLQVPLNLLSFTSLTFILTSFISSIPLISASGLERTHLNAFKTRGNHTRHPSKLRRKRFGKRALPDGWEAQGCYSDSAGPRTFGGPTIAADSMTPESCVAFCAGANYIYAGLEYGRECYCDNEVRGTGAPADSGCDMSCAGDSEQLCGGSWRLNVFKNTAPPPPLPPPPPAAPGDGEGPWTSKGCYTDNAGARTLSVRKDVDGQLTNQKCLDACAGFRYAGTEYAAECYCGNDILNSAGPTSGGCTMPCEGDTSEMCGGPDRLSFFENTATPPPTPGAPSGWSMVGCHTDSVASRSLTGGGMASNTMTPEVCTAFCANGRFEYAGVEYGAECYCGNTLGGEAATDGCTMACAGDATQACGGPDRLNLYQVVLDVPHGWTSAGCYTDGPDRTLRGGYTAADDMTHMKCATYCQGLNFKYSGTEYSKECYCGNDLFGEAANDGCTMSCGGNPSSMCGGSYRLSLFVFGDAPTDPPPDPEPEPGDPTVLETYGNWTSVGCTVDNAGGRSLPVNMPVNGAMTIQKCLDACYGAGYGYGGTEYAAECYCGIQPINGAAPGNGCTMACAGDAAHLCGGPNRLNMYQYSGDLPPVAPPGDGPPTGVITPVTEGLPEPWHYAGCWVDQEFGRVLVVESPDDPALTVEKCVDVCNSQGFTLAGIEYGVQCFCGKEIRYAGRLADNPNDCNMACGGDAEHACGAGNRISLYSSTQEVVVVPVPSPQTTDLPGDWQYEGCFAEPAYPNPRVFLRMLVMEEDMSVEACLGKCAEYGYNAAGFEFGQECNCGDPVDVATRATAAPEADCQTACTGDPAHICGGPLRLTVYRYGTSGDDGLSVWHKPENTGRYEFLLGAPIVALQTSLGINNKVTFLEKLGSGPENSTHAYELDYTLANDPEKAWREMHVKTDIFCSAGLTLPDKAGRQINVGGWSLDSTYGLRLYTPDGSFGVNGTNDWEEDVAVISLQRGRWYPSAMVMSNGSVLVMGGQIGANDKPEPSLEIVPQIPGGPTWLFLDWLERTDPFNLYPFLHVLPGGGIYVQYYNEAIILDPVTFATVKQLPLVPGAVNKIGGRTYPLEGTGVMWPIHAPYTEPVTLMSCGGSDDFYALDNCVSIQPEVEGSQWQIERMPFPRLLTCMAALPDGTFLIVNGASLGQAGFGLADQPVLTAVLYDPTQPPNKRMSILGTTIVPRMYHSEAILLHDGRVLISGSDPLDPRFDEEYRVEVYIPPYLASGLPQPTFTIAETDRDWDYNGQYTVTITSATSLNIRASLIGGEASSHGNNFGQRTIFPAIACVGPVCTITAPPDNKICPPGWFQLFILDGPTPSYSVWVRIGGDPAQLGNWPQAAAFTVPGV